MFYGGYENAERKVLIFYPDKLNDLINSGNFEFDTWIKVLRLTLPNENKGKYDHRNYLGALMKLGIKREKVGDILVDENGCDFILHKDIIKFVENNILELTRFQKSKLEEISLEYLRKVESKKEQIIITVSSTRLDNVVSELVKCSRSKAIEYLEQERIFVNYEQITKQTKEIKENDKITIRGKGRFEIKEIMGNTKKGKIKILVEK